MSKSALLKSSLAKKYMMAATGLFLCLFLVVHLLGNLTLLASDGGESFNVYAKFMTSFLPIKIISYGLYATILFHAIDGLLLVAQNRKARPVRYAMNKPSANSSFSARMMGILGSLLLVFIITHMAMYWGMMHFAGEYWSVENGTLLMIDGEEVKDLYSLVVGSYTTGVFGLPGIAWVIIYAFSQLVLAFHLWHGFASAFQSMGVRHAKWTPIIKYTGYGFAVLIPLAFAAIPVMLYVCTACSH